MLRTLQVHHQGVKLLLLYVRLLKNVLICCLCGRSVGILQVDSISTISTRCYNSLCNKFFSPHVFRLHERIPPLPHMQQIKTSKQLLKQLYYTTPMNVLTDDGPVSYEIGRSLFLKVFLWIKWYLSALAGRKCEKWNIMHGTNNMKL